MEPTEAFLAQLTVFVAITLAPVQADTLLGRASKAAMQRLMAGKRLRCELTSERTYDREVGVCYLDYDTDIGTEIISQGLAQTARVIAVVGTQATRPRHPTRYRFLGIIV